MNPYSFCTQVHFLNSSPYPRTDNFPLSIVISPTNYQFPSFSDRDNVRSFPLTTESAAASLMRDNNNPKTLGSGGVGISGMERSASHTFNVTGGSGKSNAYNSGRGSSGMFPITSGAPILRSVSMAAGIDEVAGGGGSGGKPRGPNAYIRFLKVRRNVCLACYTW